MLAFSVVYYLVEHTSQLPEYPTQFPKYRILLRPMHRGIDQGLAVPDMADIRHSSVLLHTTSELVVLVNHYV